jgi:phosphoserine aminotransferase
MKNKKNNISTTCLLVLLIALVFALVEANKNKADNSKTQAWPQSGITSANKSGEKEVKEAELVGQARDSSVLYQQVWRIEDGDKIIYFTTNGGIAVVFKHKY